VPAEGRSLESVARPLNAVRRGAQRRPAPATVRAR